MVQKKNPSKKQIESKRGNSHYIPMVKLQNLISRKSVPPFQKQLFIDVLQIRCSPVPFEVFTEKNFDNKDIKKEHDKDMCTVHRKNT